MAPRVELKEVVSTGTTVTVTISHASMREYSDFMEMVIAFVRKHNQREWHDADEVEQALSLQETGE